MFTQLKLLVWSCGKTITMGELGNVSTYANRCIIQKACPESEIWPGLWNYVNPLSSRSKQIRASGGLTTPGWRMMNYPVQNSRSTMIISVMWMLSLCHKNMYSVQGVVTGRLCTWSFVHVNTIEKLQGIISHNWIWIVYGGVSRNLGCFNVM